MKSTYRLLADRHLFLLRESVPDSFELHVFDPDVGIPSNAGDFDALLLRTVTKVNAATLPYPGNLKWVGTASAGYDHIDIDWLAGKGIAVGFAAGCNARAVAEYVLTTAAYTAKTRGWKFSGKTLGIVGAGFVGTTVANMAMHLGISVVVYDPPRVSREPSFVSSSLEQILECDLLSLHTPFVETGPYSTVGWLDAEKLRSRKRALLIQASRGGVADETAVLSALEQGDLGDAVIDVWQGEPAVNRNLLEWSIIATPHIAGYSNQAKRLATEMAVADMVRCLGGGASIHPDNVERPTLQSPTTPIIAIDAVIDAKLDLLPSALMDDFMDYDRSLRGSMNLEDPDARIREFRRLRTKVPYRDEYSNAAIRYPGAKWPFLDVFCEI